MSRHTKIKQYVDAEMDYMQDDYGDQYDNQDDFTQGNILQLFVEEWDTIYNLCEVCDVNKDRAISAFEQAEGDFDKALLVIEREKKKEEDKKAKKEKEEKEKAEKAKIRAEEKAAKDR